ncbi:fatty acid metabolism transcriptional regulator FadR [Aliidiomarina maris]|uniref:Fatty acid metabolism regulator protein n=1 Tax=Aliidiomarina maris TaxID=531312 RepID=A0A327X3U5_9GAMM|nr:fatty acid metabolism transcriptional regulator FadR [Aliidiomarina maris]MBA3988373.1 fatty acid metabolism transcriptional regulator FadR [Idiomarina sp.]MCL5051546.1 fatty acid metabolism transcriptional regulator FadR [Bacillota bacterium]RAK01810.1 GntR family transcriptional regulator [Aliidiomarina maris]RUO28621.1 fatty acid metabolism transcriptional regulator FadR [Aliidiomarina maris]
MIIKAQSPAGFAEEYIVKSIWNGHFAPGSILPAERELSELIGVTRTTLREVLQRLARDGWLTIQHGKPTRVNNFWETSGLNILETLARLDEEGMPELVDHLLSAKTNISTIYTRAAIRKNAEQVVAALDKAQALEDTPKAFADFDYTLNHEIAMASENPIYVLVLNGFKGLYARIGQFYFSSDEARPLARQYYAELRALAQEGQYDESVMRVRKYGYDSAKIWFSLRERIPANLVD